MGMLKKVKGTRPPRGPYKKTLEKKQGIAPGGAPAMNQLPVAMVNGLAEMIRPPPNSKLPAPSVAPQKQPVIRPPGIMVKNVTSLKTENNSITSNNNTVPTGNKVPPEPTKEVDSDASTDVDEDTVSKYME